MPHSHNTAANAGVRVTITAVTLVLCLVMPMSVEGAAATMLMAQAASTERQNVPNAASNQNKLSILFHNDPKPLKIGENKFEVMVKDAAGKAIKDADVSLTFYMPAMPQMKMAEMKNTVPLKHYGDGIYRGSGQVTMAGQWTVTIVVKRDGRELGTRKLGVSAK